MVEVKVVVVVVEVDVLLEEHMIGMFMVRGL